MFAILVIPVGIHFQVSYTPWIIPSLCGTFVFRSSTNASTSTGSSSMSGSGTRGISGGLGEDGGKIESLFEGNIYLGCVGILIGLS